MDKIFILDSLKTHDFSRVI